MPLPLERIGRLRTQIARGLRSSLCTAGLTLLACGALTADCNATPPTRPLLDVPWWLLLWNMISNLYHTWLNSLPHYDLTSSIKFKWNSLLITTSKSFTYAIMWPSIHILYALLGGSEFCFELEYNKQDSEHLHSIKPECICSMQFQNI